MTGSKNNVADLYISTTHPLNLHDIWWPTYPLEHHTWEALHDVHTGSVSNSCMEGGWEGHLYLSISPCMSIVSYDDVFETLLKSTLNWHHYFSLYIIS